MTTPALHPLIARLRASTRLVAWVLLVFVMKIGMVAACTVHDLDDLRMGVEGATASAQLIVGDGAGTTDDKSPDSITHGAGCVDCSCSHAAGVLSDTMAYTFLSARSDPTSCFITFPLAAPSRELRPPIL